jgi:hypothetical protein
LKKLILALALSVCVIFNGWPICPSVPEAEADECCTWIEIGGAQYQVCWC